MRAKMGLRWWLDVLILSQPRGVASDYPQECLIAMLRSQLFGLRWQKKPLLTQLAKRAS